MAAGVVGVGRWLVVSLPHRWCGLTVGGFGLFVLRMGWLVVGVHQVLFPTLIVTYVV